MVKTDKDGKGLYSEKECHNLMARICGKSKSEKNLKTYISESSKTFRDVFVLSAALGCQNLENGNSLASLPSDPEKVIRTVNETDIKDEHDNILKSIAYYHKGKFESDANCHKILININEYRKIGEKYCFLGKEKLNDLTKSAMFDSDLIKILIF